MKESGIMKDKRKELIASIERNMSWTNFDDNFLMAESVGGMYYLTIEGARLGKGDALYDIRSSKLDGIRQTAKDVGANFVIKASTKYNLSIEFYWNIEDLKVK